MRAMFWLRWRWAEDAVAGKVIVNLLVVALALFYTGQYYFPSSRPTSSTQQAKTKLDDEAR